MTGVSATPWQALGFALFGGAALLIGLLRHRGAWPVAWWPDARRAAAVPTSLDDPVVGPPSIWHGGVLQRIDSARFHALCAAMFQQDGCRTRSMPAAGSDFLLQRLDDLPARGRLVRVQAGLPPTSCEPVLRAFATAVAAAEADAGIFIAAGPVEAPVATLARQHAITLVDGPALLKLIVQRSVRQQRALREIATPPAEANPSRFALAPTPTPAWFAMAGASLLAAWVSWPAARTAVLAPDETGESARLAETSPRLGRSLAVDPERTRPPRAAPATNADLDPPAVTVSPPAAGRQVLRCTDAGRVTYLAADASCAGGHGERITVFPTEGVNPFR